MSPPIRLSPSMLDSWEWHLTTDNGSTFHDLIRDLLYLGEPTEAMNIGTAIHQHLETGANPVLVGQKKYQIRTKDDMEVVLPRAQAQEFRLEKSLTAHGQEVVLSGIIDGVIGNRLLEYKTTSRAPSFEKYFTKMQWRCYLWMSDCPSLEYHVLQYRRQGDAIIIHHQTSYVVRSYEGMVDEIQSACNDIVGFLVAMEAQNIIARDREPPHRWIPGPEFDKVKPT